MLQKRFMDYPKSSIPNLAITSLIIAGIISICIFSSSSTHKPLFSLQNSQCQNLNSSGEGNGGGEDVDELGAVLRKAATEDKNVIIAVVNRAYAEQNDVAGKRPAMLDLFLESFWVGEGTRGLLEHLLVVAVDQTAYERCKFRRLHCFRLETEGVDFGGEKLYMSQDFIKMMWRRTLFLLDVLRRGYSFIFTDTDVMWLRDPFLRLDTRGGEDLQISTDQFRSDDLPLQTHFINTGFYYVRSNNRTVSLFELWHASKDRFPGNKEQDVLIELIQEGAVKNMSLAVKFMDTRYFSGFCQDSQDGDVVTTVHANCCRSISAKVADLSVVLRAWKKSRVTGVLGRVTGSNNSVSVDGGVHRVPWSYHHGACANSWAIKASNTTN